MGPFHDRVLQVLETAGLFPLTLKKRANIRGVSAFLPRVIYLPLQPGNCRACNKDTTSVRLGPLQGSCPSHLAVGILNTRLRGSAISIGWRHELAVLCNSEMRKEPHIHTVLAPCGSQKLRGDIALKIITTWNTEMITKAGK